MKALQYLGPKSLQFAELPTPSIMPNEVLMKVKKVGICGTDLHIYSGGMNVPTPMIMGHEFVGEVFEVGSEVTKFKKGDRIVAEHVIGCGECQYCKEGKKNICTNPTVIGLHKPGALAEFLVLPEELIYKIPENMDYDTAVLIEPLSIALYAVRKSDIKIGDSAVVIGQGPIGLFLDQVLKATGTRVVGVDVIDTRLNFAKENNFVDSFVNSKEPDAIKLVLNLTDNIGADVVFEAVGKAPTAELAINVAKSGGKIVLQGVFETKVDISLMQVVKRELTILGLWTCLDTFDQTIKMLGNNEIKTDKLITHRYKFLDAIKAFEDASSYDDNRIKTVIEMD